MSQPINSSIHFGNNPKETIDELQRVVEKAYAGLPWPSNVKNVAIFTEVKGGLGDISAASKFIKIIQNLNPAVNLKWIVESSLYSEEYLRNFLKTNDVNDASITIENKDMVHSPFKTDLLVVGPNRCQHEDDYLTSKYSIQPLGKGIPRFSFLECATPITDQFPMMFKIAGVFQDTFKKFYDLTLGPPSSHITGIALGLKKGSGVFLDQKRMQAELSEKYSDPKYISEIEEEPLRMQILEAFKDNASLNFGYAHHNISRLRFIDSVATHEKEKNVVLVINQEGEFKKYSTIEFFGTVADKKRLKYLETLGYNELVVVDTLGKYPIKISKNPGRSLTIIVRPRFLPQDMRPLQLASERLLATGDNTACESWASRCKLYLYEDVNKGCKKEFLTQQIKIASAIYPPLGRFIELCGKTEVLYPKEHEELLTLLNDPKLSEGTYAFCMHIIQNYSAEQPLEASILRMLWLNQIPTLTDEERNVLGDVVEHDCLQALSDPEHIPVHDLPLDLSSLSHRIQKIVHEGIKSLIP